MHAHSSHRPRPGIAKRLCGVATAALVAAAALLPAAAMDGASLIEGLLQRLEHEGRMRGPRCSSADDAVSVSVDHDRDVDEA
jgi:hypothetical protein